MTHMNPDPAKVEVLKVWYSVFCTVVDAYRREEYTANEFCEKMAKLRDKLKEAFPHVEAEMAQHHQ